MSENPPRVMIVDDDLAARAAGMDRSNFRRILEKHRLQGIDDAAQSPALSE